MNRRSEIKMDVSGTTSGLEVALLMVVLPVTGTAAVNLYAVVVDIVDVVVSVIFGGAAVVETTGILDVGDLGIVTLQVVVCPAVVEVETNVEVVMGE